MAHNYTPVCEISEVDDTEEESQVSASSSTYSTSTPQYELPVDSKSEVSFEWDQSNDNMGTEFDKMNLKTAKEVVKIRKSVQDATAQAHQNMFDRRNHANREWQEMETSGRAERQKTYLETIDAVQEIEETTEEKIKAQEEALNKYKLQKESEKLAAAIQFKEQKTFIQNQHKKSISVLESAGQEQRKQTQINLEKDKEQAQKGITQIKQSENAKRGQILNSHQDKMNQMKKEMQEKLEAERRKQAELSKPKPYSRLNPMGYIPDSWKNKSKK